LKFADLKGKVVLIQFSFLGCGPCLAMDPHMDRWHEELKDEGLVVIEVDDGRADDLESIRRWVDQAGIKFPVYYDAGGKMTTDYDINSYPTRFIIGRDGKVFEKNGGWGGERGVQEIEKSLKKALAAK
jgi:thiol-disulfide isomerase/thioredoxin